MHDPRSTIKSRARWAPALAALGALALAICLAACGSSGGSSEGGGESSGGGEIVVGSLLDTTGPLDIYGKEMTNATNMAPRTCGSSVRDFCRKAAPSAICSSTRTGVMMARDRMDGQP